jgi:voltage-gated potassium channel Kch
MDTLHHAHVHAADLVISTIPDAILKGTDNLRILRQARRLCPDAKVIVTADRIGQAVELYGEGADFVYLPRLHSARDLARAVEEGLRRGFDAAREQHLIDLAERDEVLA